MTARLTPTFIAGVAAACAWLLYVWVSPGTAGWYDATEFVAAGQQLGVGHSPGEPVYLMVLRGAQLLPLGDLTSRAAWVSAACAAGIVAVVVLLTAELLGRHGSPLALVFAAAVCLAAGPLLTQAVVIELYGMQVLLILVCALAVLRSERVVGALPAAGLLLGLALAVNPLLAVLATPGLFLLALAAGVRLQPRRLGITALAVLLGMTGYLYLPLRSAAEPMVWFGVIDDMDSMWGFMSGRPYARSFGPVGADDVARNLLLHIRLLVGWVGIPACAVAIVGLFPFLRARSLAFAGTAVLGIGAWLATVPRSAVETYPPDLSGYLLISCVPAWIAAAWAVAALSRRHFTMTCVAATVTVVVTAWGGWTMAARYTGHQAEQVAVILLEATPPGGLLVTGSDSTSLPVMAAVTSGRRRPDVMAFSAYGTSPELLRRRAAGRPHVQVPDAALLHGADPESRLAAMLGANRQLPAVGTPLLWPPSEWARRQPAGLGVALARGPVEETRLRARHAHLRETLVDPLWTGEELRRDRQLRRLLAATASMQAGAEMWRQHPDRAHETLAAASALHPDPTSLVHLQRASVENGSWAPPTPHEPGSDGARGRAALLAGDYGLAADLLGRAAARERDDPELWNELGHAAFWSGDPSAAARAWDEALRLRPCDAQALAGAERLYSMGIQ